MRVHDSLAYKRMDVTRQRINRRLQPMEANKWMSSNKLKPGDEKAGDILCGSKTQREKVSVDAVCVGNSKVPLSSANTKSRLDW